MRRYSTYVLQRRLDLNAGRNTMSTTTVRLPDDLVQRCVLGDLRTVMARFTYRFLAVLTHPQYWRCRSQS